MESLAIADETASEETIPQKIQDQNETEKSIIEPSTTLSKKKQKKLMKEEQWLKQKAEMRNMQKLKRKQKRREKIERGEDTGPSKKMLKKNTMENSSCDIRVAIDCSFDDLMAEKDINKLGQQIQYCYSSNRRAQEPLQFYLTSLGNKTKVRLDRIGDYRGWDIHIDSMSYLEKFDKSSIVYLTSDSPNILQSLMPDKVYIIGGLVDHNHHKSLCFNLAVEKGIAHAQLPIGEFIQLSSRKVLTVNHVFEILLRYTETQSWKEAFFQVIPKRKQVGGSCDASDNNSTSDNFVKSDVIDNDSADDSITCGHNDNKSASGECLVSDKSCSNGIDDSITDEISCEAFEEPLPQNDRLSCLDTKMENITEGHEVNEEMLVDLLKDCLTDVKTALALDTAEDISIQLL